MVGVGQDQAGAQLAQLVGGNGLDRGLGAHGRKCRGKDRAMGCVKDAGPGVSGGRLQLKGEGRRRLRDCPVLRGGHWRHYTQPQARGRHPRRP
jgi:hypothetical protein